MQRISTAARTLPTMTVVAAFSGLMVDADRVDTKRRQRITTFLAGCTQPFVPSAIATTSTAAIRCCTDTTHGGFRPLGAAVTEPCTHQLTRTTTSRSTLRAT